eukprot:Opistho-1_new@67390
MSRAASGALRDTLSATAAPSTFIQDAHNYTHTPDDTCRVAIRGGCDLDCGDFYQKNMEHAAADPAVASAVDVSIVRLFGHRIRLGEFDPAASQPYRRIAPDAVDTQAHRALALAAARESLVLLHNPRNVLPLSRDAVKTVAIVGPNANASETMQGNYYGRAPFLVTPVAGFAAEMGSNEQVLYAQGTSVTGTDKSGFAAATDAASKADAVVVVLGIDTSVEAEGQDRTSIDMPGVQWDLLRAVRAATQKPVIAVIMSGSSIDLSPALDACDALLWAGYPGQYGGQAIAEAVFGVFSPSGRLPFTVYPASYADEVDFFNMSMRAGTGRTYRFYTGKPVFPFGFGLSYTTFSYSWETETAVASIDASAVAGAQDRVASYRVNVTNTGKVASAVSVLSFIEGKDQHDGALRELIGFEKVFLAPGETQTLFFGVTAHALSTVDNKGLRALRPGSYSVFIGGDALRAPLVVQGPVRAF